jgi:hypothetical protein
MERLAEQIVDWHNRHPLARRIGVADVHTIGVVALPFVRASAQTGGIVEPILTDAVSAFDQLLDSPPASLWAVWSQRLKGLARLPGRRPRQQWRAFNEKFLPGLSPRRIEGFALAHGYTEPPATPELRPWRVIVIDEKRASKYGGWPFELYLMSAGIDVGSARTRVLCGRGIPSQIIGRRLWHPLRLGLVAGVLALLIAAATWALWPSPAAKPAPPPAATMAAPTAPAASNPAPVAAAPVRPDPASAAGEAASAPGAAAEPAEPASAAASGAEAAASEPSDPPPDIRPHLVERRDGIKRPPLRSSKVDEGPADTPSDKPLAKPAKPVDQAAKETAEPTRKAEAVDPRIARLAKSPDQPAVALVGPPGSKAEAEAMLKKIRAGLVGVHSNPEALQADVIQTPEGWRAAVWPFPSREQAQLINATLVARGLKTKAVNF